MAALVELSALGFRFLPGHHPVGIDLDRAHPDVSLRGFAITGKKGRVNRKKGRVKCLKSPS